MKIIGLCNIWVPYKCSLTFATETFAIDRVLFKHFATQTFAPETIAFQTFALPLFQNHPNHSAIQTFALLFFKVLFIPFTSWWSYPCKFCLNRSTIKTDMQQMAADSVTCWAKGYCLVVLYVFCQLGLKKWLCCICVLYKHSSKFTTDKSASYLSWLCFKLAKSHCLDTI